MAIDRPFHEQPGHGIEKLLFVVGETGETVLHFKSFVTDILLVPPAARLRVGLSFVYH
jgi:hypothetical protein